MAKAAQHPLPSIPLCLSNWRVRQSSQFQKTPCVLYMTIKFDTYHWLADQTVFYCQKVAPAAQHPPAIPALPWPVSWSLTVAAGFRCPRTAASCCASAFNNDDASLTIHCLTDTGQQLKQNRQALRCDMCWSCHTLCCYMCISTTLPSSYVYSNASNVSGDEW